MKTLIVTLEYPPQVGGIASYVYNLASANPKQVIVWAPQQTEAAAFDQAHHWKVYRGRPYWFMWPRWLRLLIQIGWIVRKEKVDQLFIHHILPVGHVAWVIKKLFKIPYTVFLHGSDFQVVVSKTKLFTFRKICKGAERVIVNSEFSQRKLQTIVAELPAVTIIYPSPNPAFFKFPDSFQVTALRGQLALQGKKVILTVARLVERKGHLFFARILPKILEQVPNAVWVVVGDGPKENELYTIIQNNALQNAVRFLGPLPQSSLPALYHAADVFVLLTHKDEDGVDEAWGTVFIEAAACGLPVVAGRSGGVEEAVEHGRTGIIVDMLSEAAVVKNVVDILKNQAFAEQLADEGQKRATEKFTLEKQFSKLTW